MTPRTRSILLGAGGAVAVVAVVGWVVMRRGHPPPPKRIVATIVTDPSSPEVVERSVAMRAEEAAAAIALVQRVESRSTASSVTLTVTLEPAGDVEVAAHELSAALIKAGPQFPRATSASEITRESRIVRFVVHGEVPPLLVRDSIRPTLLGVPGVTSVAACGTRDAFVDVTLDPTRLAAFGIRPDSIELQLLGAGLATLRTVDDLRAIEVGKDSFRLDSVATIARVEEPNACRSFDSSGERTMIEVGVIDPRSANEPLKAAAAGIALPPKVTLDAFDLAPTTTIFAEVALAASPTPAESGEIARRIAKAVEGVPEAHDVVVVHDARANADFVVRVALMKDVLTELARESVARAIHALPGLEVVTVDGASSEAPAVMILGPDWDELVVLAKDVRDTLARTEGVRGAITVGTRVTPTVTFDVDRIAAARYGLDESLVKDVAKLATTGETVGAADGAPVRLFLGKNRRMEDVGDAIVLTATGAIPLSQVSTVKSTSGPAAITRYDRMRATRVDVDATRAMDGAKLLAALKDIRLPSGYTIVAR